MSSDARVANWQAWAKSSRLRAHSPVTVAAVLLSAGPIAFAVWYVQGFSLVVPLLDQWKILDLYDRMAAGRATLRDFFAPHYGVHVILVPRLVLSAVAFLTHLNFRVEVYIGFIL